MIQNFVSDSDRQRIRSAVEAAEQATSGEFVTAIAKRADTYPLLPVAASAFLTLFLSGLVLLIWPVTSSVLYFGQVLCFVLLYFVFRWPPLTLALVPKSIRQRRARRLARDVFMRLGLSAKEERSGVLLFVSAGEHYVEIIADRGVQQYVTDEDWQRIVDGFIDKVRSGQVADGFVEAIDACATLMARHLPPRPDQKSRLPDHLVEI